MRFEYAIIVRSKTRLEALIERFNTKAQAKFYIESLGGVFEEYEVEHETFYQSLHSLQSQLGTVLKSKTIDRSFLPSFIFSEKYLIIVIGQDGLVANTAKYSKGLPIIAVNPDKERYDGVLLPFDDTDFLEGVQGVLAESQPMQSKRFAEVNLNDNQRLLAFNDLFIGPSSHVSARYKISYGDLQEEQSSSGVIVSTRAGSTGWLSSIFNMSVGISKLLESDVRQERLDVGENELVFAVREPFKSVRTQANIVAGTIKEGESVKIESYMPFGGLIFSDGIESDFLHFNSGSIATIRVSSDFALLVLK